MARRRNPFGRVVPGPAGPVSPVVGGQFGANPLSKVGLAPGISIQNGHFVGPDGKPLAPGTYGAAPYTPYQQPQAPPGTYDPNLDISLSAAGRGLSDTTQDIATANTRDTTDYLTGVGQLDQTGAREGQDYASRVAMLTRSYDQLGNRQGQQQAQAGVEAGGAALQAAAKRQANMALERAPIDTAHTRAGEDIQRSRDQLALELAPPTADSPLGGRRFQDRGTQLSRGQRELAQFGIDTSTVKNFQATQSGLFDIPGPPANEHIGKSGNPYRVIVRGDQRLTVDPNGRILSRKKRR